MLIEINAITDLGELKRILEADEKIEIKYFDKNFHAKIYVFDNSVLLGSANLTYQGLTEKQEAVIKLCHEESPDVIQEIRDLFDEFWEAAGELTKDKLVEIEKEHKELSRLTKDVCEARNNFKSKRKPIDAGARASKRKRFKRRKYKPDIAPPRSNGIDRKELRKACEMVFGTSRSMTSGKDRPVNPPMRCIEGLNLYFATIQCKTDPYRVFFLPESWIKPMGRTWLECKWNTGFFWQPLIADFNFSAKMDKMTLFGQLETQRGSDRRMIVNRIEEAAKQNSLQNRIEFGTGSHTDSKQSAFFIDNICDLNGKYDAKSLAQFMRKAIKDFKPAIEVIGESLR